MASKATVRGLFLGLQHELLAKLSVNRDLITHSVSKGDATELDWLGMLRDYLPKRYAAERAFVLDADGKLSDQIDIVIFDQQYCPFLFNRNGVKYIPAESVYAAFEVKQALSRAVITYAAEKVASVRQLRRTSTTIPHAGGIFAPKSQFPIIGGILTLDSDWTPALCDSLRTAVGDQSDDGRLDLGCCLLRGGFEVLYPEADAPRIEVSGSETALVFFLLRLLERLQRLGTVPALDLREYGAQL